MTAETVQTIALTLAFWRDRPAPPPRLPLDDTPEPPPAAPCVRLGAVPSREALDLAEAAYALALARLTGPRRSPTSWAAWDEDERSVA